MRPWPDTPAAVKAAWKAAALAVWGEPIDRLRSFDGDEGVGARERDGEAYQAEAAADVRRARRVMAFALRLIGEARDAEAIAVCEAIVEIVAEGARANPRLAKLLKSLEAEFLGPPGGRA